MTPDQRRGCVQMHDMYLREAELWFLESINPHPTWQRHHAEMRMWEHLIFWAIYEAAAAACEWERR